MSRRDTAVPEELRQTSQAAAALANAMLGTGSSPEGQQAPRSSGSTDSGSGAAQQHHKDAVPEGLRHTSEVAAELASRVFSAISERMHFGGHHGEKHQGSAGGGGGGGGGAGGGGREGQ